MIGLEHQTIIPRTSTDNIVTDLHADYHVQVGTKQLEDYPLSKSSRP